MIPDDDNETLDIVELDETLDDAKQPPVLQAGVYTAEIQDVQQKTSQAGNAYYAVKCVIANRDLPGDLREFYDDGVVLYWNRQLVPQPGGDPRTIWNLKQFYQAMGLSAGTSAIDPNDWMGRRIKLRVQMGKYLGEMRPEIKSIEAAEAEAPKAATKKGGRGK